MWLALDISMLPKKVNFKQIERKWQKAWAAAKVFEVNESSHKKKFYCLEMFPYPSASFLHMGHIRNYSIGDLLARYKRMKGFNVLYPMGFDAFGLPAENAAIKTKTHPKKYTENAIKVIKRLMQELGLSYDWSRSFATCYPEYYRWNQWIFLRMLEKGIAYRKKAPVNWCPSCNTVLANEEAEGGHCWRCNSEVVIKHLDQWFLNITKYAEELLADLDKVHWPERTKEIQRNWIGKSEGTKIIFSIKGTDKTLEVFTTRADTIYGVSFVACALQNPLVAELVAGTKQEKTYQTFLKKVSVSEKLDGDKEKEGFFTGKYAIHPLTGKEIPIFAGTFVVADYGSGAVMGVPAHDVRDFAFAKKHKLPSMEVVHAEGQKKPYVGKGKLINSEEFNGLASDDARLMISQVLQRKSLGGPAVEYRLRDWLISRQRYWGTPIPIIYCDRCGAVPVPDKELPVLLPEKVKFTGKGNPLTTNKDFVHVDCPSCGESARRETDTMGTFFDSSWYYLRYCSPDSHDVFDRKAVSYWMPVDQYIGGIEHAATHLLYARFFTKFLRDLGWLVFDEPFMRLFNQGIVHKDGKRMSKSQNNAVTAEEISERYGIDAARLFLLMVASPEKDMEWSDHGIEGAYRVVMKFIELFNKVGGSSDDLSEHKLHKTLRDVEHGYEHFEFNKAILSFVDLVNFFSQRQSVPRHVLELMLLMISPVMPHIAEEFWHRLGGAALIAQDHWPQFNAAKINVAFDQQEEKMEKTVADILNILKLVKGSPKKVYLYTIPPELKQYDVSVLERRVGLPVAIFAVNDAKKYDPQQKAGRAKPGRPAVYIE